MREHEVPTHVQAEDRVLLGFTFPQVVAVMAVFALSYGAYRYAPVGPSEVRMALAVLFGLVGVAMVVGKIGGRRLPLVAADLLKYRLGARRYAGQTAQLVRAEPPAPPQPVKTGPGPIRLMVRKARRGLRRLRKKKNRQKERRNGRMPFRPHGWFGKRRGKDGGKHQGPSHMAETLEIRRRKPHRGWIAVVAVVLAAAVTTAPPGGPGRRPRALAGGDRLRGRGAAGGTADIRRGAHRLRRPRRRHPAGRHRPGHPGAGLRRPAGELAALLGLGNAGRGGEHRLLPPPPRPGAVLHRLVGGHPRPGRGADRQARADPVPAPRRRGRALRPAHDLPGLDAGSGQRRHRVRVRHAHRSPGGASDGGRAPERHRDVPDGRPGDGSHGDRRRRDRRVAGKRLVRPQRRDPVPTRRARGAVSDSRRERGREP